MVVSLLCVVASNRRVEYRLRAPGADSCGVAGRQATSEWGGSSSGSDPRAFVPTRTITPPASSLIYSCQLADQSERMHRSPRAQPHISRTAKGPDRQTDSQRARASREQHRSTHFHRAHSSQPALASKSSRSDVHSTREEKEESWRGEKTEQQMSSCARGRETSRGEFIRSAGLACPSADRQSFSPRCLDCIIASGHIRESYHAAALRSSGGDAARS